MSCFTSATNTVRLELENAKFRYNSINNVPPNRFVSIAQTLFEVTRFLSKVTNRHLIRLYVYSRTHVMAFELSVWMSSYSIFLNCLNYRGIFSNLK